jgi:hypothetical protein
MSAAGWLAVQSTLPQALAAVPPTIAAGTGAAASALAAGAALASLVPSVVVELVQTARTMWMRKVQMLAVLLVGITAAGGGVATVSYHTARPTSAAVTEFRPAAAQVAPPTTAPTEITIAPTDERVTEPPAKTTPEQLPLPREQPERPAAANQIHRVCIIFDSSNCCENEGLCRGRSCRTSATVIVVSQRSRSDTLPERPRAGLAWREQGEDVEMTHRVYRVIVVSGRDHAEVLAEVVKYLILTRV